MKISPSKLRKITACLYQYKLHYLDGWRQKKDKAIFAFGHACHEVVTESLSNRFKDNPDHMFAKKWLANKDKDLHYNKGDSFDKAMELGRSLCRKIPEVLRDITGISDIESKFDADLSGIHLNGYVDFIGKYKGKKTLFDIKTLRTVSPYEVSMSDQLTTYSMAKRIPRVGIIAMVKTKSDPRIEIHTGTKTKEDYIDLQRKIKRAVTDISQQYYSKANDKMTCQMCEFVPICFGTKKEVAAKLKQVDMSQHTKNIQQKRRRRRKSLFW